MEVEIEDVLQSDLKCTRNVELLLRLRMWKEMKAKERRCYIAVRRVISGRLPS